jgi:hypothetical protein
MANDDGYIMIDHRASPGMPEDVLRQAGIDMPAVGEGQVMECAIMVCRHCQQPYIRNPARARERASCMKCGGKYICDLCEFESRQPGYVHRPFLKVVDDAREQASRQESGNLFLPLMAKTS